MEPKNSKEIVGEGEVSVADQTHGVATADQTDGANQNQGVQAGVQETSNHGGRRTKMMPGVPMYIREKYNSEDYDPLVVSFGPYYENRVPRLRVFKAMALKWFLTGNLEDATSDFWLTKVDGMVPELQRCYAEGSTYRYSRYDFGRPILEDACLAILIMGVANQEQQDIALLSTHLGPATVDGIIRDSLVLENQLPFWFIRDLLHSKFGYVKGEERWKKHFMFLCHGRIKSRKDKTSTTTTTTTTVYWDEEAGEPAHFVEALKIAYRSGWKKENIEPKYHALEEGWVVLSKDDYAVHSVTELKAKGITVQPNSTNSFENITFQSGYFSGTLQIPVDIVNYGSKAAYSNIIAYEMSTGNHTQDYTMTAYVHLMKSLVQSPKDVEELQANGIIINRLGSNEQVVNLYRDIYTFGTICSDKFGETCQKMDSHYNNEKKTWLAEFLYTYFRSPWTAIALFGSFLVVILTIMQTYYAATDDKGGDKGKSPP